MNSTQKRKTIQINSKPCFDTHSSCEHNSLVSAEVVNASEMSSRIVRSSSVGRRATSPHATMPTVQYTASEC
jgi:hypothetical protein